MTSDAITRGAKALAEYGGTVTGRRQEAQACLSAAYPEHSKPNEPIILTEEQAEKYEELVKRRSKPVGTPLPLDPEQTEGKSKKFPWREWGGQQTEGDEEAVKVGNYPLPPDYEHERDLLRRKCELLEQEVAELRKGVGSGPGCQHCGCRPAEKDGKCGQCV